MCPRKHFLSPKTLNISPKIIYASQTNIWCATTFISTLFLCPRYIFSARKHIFDIPENYVMPEKILLCAETFLIPNLLPCRDCRDYVKCNIGTECHIM